jgi:carboxyl-terminal processing protease
LNNTLKIVLTVALVVIVGSTGFLGGYVFANASAVPFGLSTPAADSGTLSKRVSEVERMLKRRALNPPEETSATAGAIQGLLGASGDKYGLYFDEDRFKYFNEDSMGEFGGIGVVLGEKEQGSFVVEVFKGTPAEKAGIKPGDIFAAIDGERRDRWTTEEVVKLVRGKEGTDVELVLLRPDEDGDLPTGHPGAPAPEEVTFTVTRAMIELPNIEAELKGDVGYVRVSQFNGKTAEEITREIDDLAGKGAKSFVLDLRDNPGGLLQEAVDVASLFVDSGAIVHIEERGTDLKTLRAKGGKLTGAPLVLLVNGNSASASEIVAGALQDHERAKIVGEKTFGKGSVQTIEQLSFGGAVKFTTAHYLTPKKRVIDGKGVEPDTVVEMEREKQAEEETDTQLQKALEIARGLK